MSDILSLDSRRKIYEHVGEHSGCHLREIGRKCDLPLGTALYHLDRLEAEGLVTVRRDGRYKRYFPANGLGRREKDLLSAFRHDVPRRVAVALLNGGAMTQRELCRVVGVSRSTLSFHVNNLIDKGILRRERVRPENHYLLEDRELADSILARYRESLGDVSPMNEPGTRLATTPGMTARLTTAPAPLGGRA